MKIYEVFYSDGVLAETIEFDESCTEEFIEAYLTKTVDKYNECENEDYHISIENIKELTINDCI